jgi:hypothetical protein
VDGLWASDDEENAKFRRTIGNTKICFSVGSSTESGLFGVASAQTNLAATLGMRAYWLSHSGMLARYSP